jgi:hypothetical protein
MKVLEKVARLCLALIGAFICFACAVNAINGPASITLGIALPFVIGIIMSLMWLTTEINPEE